MALMGRCATDLRARFERTSPALKCAQGLRGPVAEAGPDRIDQLFCLVRPFCLLPYLFSEFCFRAGTLPFPTHKATARVVKESAWDPERFDCVRDLGVDSFGSVPVAGVVNEYSGVGPGELPPAFNLCVPNTDVRVENCKVTPPVVVIGGRSVDGNLGILDVKLRSSAEHRAPKRVGFERLVVLVALEVLEDPPSGEALSDA